MKRKAVSDVSDIADEYRRKAAEACRRLADLSPETERKVHWIQQATEWDRLAAEAAKQSAKLKFQRDREEFFQRTWQDIGEEAKPKPF